MPARVAPFDGYVLGLFGIALIDLHMQHNYRPVVLVRGKMAQRLRERAAACHDLDINCHSFSIRSDEQRIKFRYSHKKGHAVNVSTNRRTADQLVLLIGILLIAANLRAPFTGLPPLLGLIRADLDLSTTAASALTTLPLLAFALVAPFSAMFAREYGLERTLVSALAVIALGIVLRSAGVLWCLYIGTGLIGMGIAVGNVLLPSLVKRDFPDNIAVLTGAYALAMGVAAAVCSTAVIPVVHAWGWRGALTTFLVLPLAAMAAWIAQVSAHTQPAAGTATPLHGGKIWHSALAWQVTLFFGLNATIYYVAIGWLPTILIDSGLSPERAGSLHGVLQLATAVPGLLIGPVLRRLRDQRLLAAASATLSGISLLGLLVAPQLAFVWSVLFGMGTGAGMILGLTFIGLQAGNAHQAGTLSGMFQWVYVSRCHSLQQSWVYWPDGAAISTCKFRALYVGKLLAAMTLWLKPRQSSRRWFLAASRHSEHDDNRYSSTSSQLHFI
jgi:CP family cyanate transporter-like MFS transporter